MAKLAKRLLHTTIYTNQLVFVMYKVINDLKMHNNMAIPFFT